MKLTKLTKACLSVMLMGVVSTTLPALTMHPAIVQHVNGEKEWTLLDTKDGVTCYYQVGPLGTCNNVVLLKVTNTSASAVIVNFNVVTDGVAIAKKITVDAGQTLDASTDPSLSIRPASNGEPVVSFTVSK